MQLPPHFLFNTLHAISALMYRNLEDADRMITRLSDFLRLALDSAGVQGVPLRRGMEYLDKHLEDEATPLGGAPGGAPPHRAGDARPVGSEPGAAASGGKRRAARHRS